MEPIKNWLSHNARCPDPDWMEGAAANGINAVWGILRDLGGQTPKENAGPGDLFDELKPMTPPD